MDKKIRNKSYLNSVVNEMCCNDNNKGVIVKKINKKLFFGIGMISFSSLMLCNVVSCNNDNQRINEEKVNIIKEDESIQNIMKRFENDSTLRNNNLDIFNENDATTIKKVLSEEIIIDENSMIYYELKENNKLDVFLENYINDCYEMLIENFDEDETEKIININVKHGWNPFKKHTWETFGQYVKVTAINLLCVVDVAIQVIPTIVYLAQSYDPGPLVDTLTALDVSPITSDLLVRTILDVKRFKIRTNCSSKFFIWGQLIN